MLITFKLFKLNNLGDYHDLYVQSDTLLLVDAFENFRKACIKTYELDPAHFISLPGLAWQACLKKTGVELELLTDYDMLLMIEEGKEVEYVTLYIDMQRQIMNT